jgi:hypothetical protein
MNKERIVLQRIGKAGYRPVFASRYFATQKYLPAQRLVPRSACVSPRFPLGCACCRGSAGASPYPSPTRGSAGASPYRSLLFRRFVRCVVGGPRRFRG